jgi:hypothetical protein
MIHPPRARASPGLQPVQGAAMTSAPLTIAQRHASCMPAACQRVMSASVLPDTTSLASCAAGSPPPACPGIRHGALHLVHLDPTSSAALLLPAACCLLPAQAAACSLLAARPLAAQLLLQLACCASCRALPSLSPASPKCHLRRPSLSPAQAQLVVVLVHLGHKLARGLAPHCLAAGPPERALALTTVAQPPC